MTTTRLLILETSGRVGHVALADDQGILVLRQLEETRRHARDLASSVQAMLLELGWPPNDVTATCVSIGPGSYTGLRVGIMSAKAFAYASGGILLGIPTFPALALRSLGANRPIVDVLADAQQQHVYCQRFRQDPLGLPEAVEPLRIMPFAAWLEAWDAAAGVTGPAATLHAAHLPPSCLVEEAEREPDPFSIHRLALLRLARGERDDVMALEPLYLRPSSAEEKWKALGK